jgi:Nitrile hydratase beta subunit
MMRNYHDMGGLPADTVVPTEHDYALWEKRVDAMQMLLKEKQLLTTDEMRRNIESLGVDVYERLTYYERWCAAITNTLIQRGVITIDELAHKIAEVKARDGGVTP